ncbi:MAG: hypothetical protein P4L98_23705 [Ancalomicrobiaceae bacterium]|nr:hypothetical protein [Ancalomicrobiaceae bacterium]
MGRLADEMIDVTRERSGESGGGAFERRPTRFDAAELSAGLALPDPPIAQGDQSRQEQGPSPGPDRGCRFDHAAGALERRPRAFDDGSVLRFVHLQRSATAPSERCEESVFAGCAVEGQCERRHACSRFTRIGSQIDNGVRGKLIVGGDGDVGRLHLVECGCGCWPRQQTVELDNEAQKTRGDIAGDEPKANVEALRCKVRREIPDPRSKAGSIGNEKDSQRLAPGVGARSTMSA